MWMRQDWLFVSVRGHVETVEDSGIETSVANAGLSQPGVAGSLSCCLKGNKAYEWSNSKSLVIREHIKHSILYQLVCHFLVDYNPVCCIWFTHGRDCFGWMLKWMHLKDYCLLGLARPSHIQMWCMCRTYCIPMVFLNRGVIEESRLVILSELSTRVVCTRGDLSTNWGQSEMEEKYLVCIKSTSSPVSHFKP